MSAPIIGFTKSADVHIDLEVLLETRLLIQASSGAGKSWAIRYLLEKTHGRVQQIVIDREGDFVSLRDKFPYLLVGPEGDIRAERRAAKLLARKLLELKVSAIIDLSEMTPETQREFVGLFCGELAHLPRAYWTPCLVVIDEAHLFAPQKRKSDSTSPVEELVSLGRKRGFCAILATQRLAKLDKDVAGECLNKLIGRVSDIDVKRAGEELDFDRKGGKDLRNLEPGEFWAYGPAISLEPLKVRTGDIKTMPPKRGELRPPAPPPPASIRAMLEQLTDLPKQADEEARTLSQLRKENAELKTRLTRAEKHAIERIVEKKVVDQDAIDKAVQFALTSVMKEVRQRQTQLLKAISDVSVKLRKKWDVVKVGVGDTDAIIEALSKIPGDLGELPPLALGVPRKRTDLPPPVTLRTERSIPARPVQHSDDGASLRRGERKILEVLSQRYPVAVTRDQLATLSGFTASGGTYGTYFGVLKRHGLLSEDVRNGDTLITDAGFQYLGLDGPPVPQTTDEILDMWRGALRAGERKMLDALYEVYPETLSKAELGERSGYAIEGGTFGTYLGILRRNGLADVRGDEVKMSDTVFQENGRGG